MRSRLPSWVLLLYVAIDLANPFVPGAFRFTPEEGLVWVEGMPQPRADAGADTSATRRFVPIPRRVASDGGLVVAGEPTRAGYLTAWLVGVRTGDPPSRDLPPSESDEH